MIAKLLQSLGRGPRQSSSASAIVPAIVAKFQPKIVIDVGCGDGAWLREFWAHGVRGVGFDKQAVKKADGWRTERCDLEKLSYLPYSDVALCIEVAEHLSMRAGLKIVELLCKSAEVVVWGAGIPLIGGYGHINERWPSFWAHHFKEFGLYPHDDLRMALWNADVPGWYPQDLLVYCTPDTACRYELTRTRILDIIHPNVWSRIGPMGICQRLSRLIPSFR